MNIERWKHLAETRVEMAISETVKQLQYEANALWKGKKVYGETVLEPCTPIEGTVNHIAIYYHPANYPDAAYMEVAVYATVNSPEGEKDLLVYKPRFPDEETP
jgi:hypothetical protein